MLYVVWRMLKVRPTCSHAADDEVLTHLTVQESAVFCALLAVFAIGFGQALTGLDVADEKRDSTKGACSRRCV